MSERISTGNKVAIVECFCTCHHPTPGNVEMHTFPCCEGRCNGCGKWLVTGLASHEATCAVANGNLVVVHGEVAVASCGETH